MARRSPPRPRQRRRSRKRRCTPRLGGKPAITAVVDEFVERVAADKRINMRFLNTDIPHLRELLVEFVCMATGGPRSTRGATCTPRTAACSSSTRSSTRWSRISSGALDKFKVPEREKGELLGALGPLKPQIVNPPSAAEAKHDPALVTKGDQLAALAAQERPRPSRPICSRALTARVRGQRNYAEQLFSAAERSSDPASCRRSIAASSATARRRASPPR